MEISVKFVPLSLGLCFLCIPVPAQEPAAAGRGGSEAGMNTFPCMAPLALCTWKYVDDPPFPLAFFTP